ncbi:hypothetical protein ATCR1_14696 [Agrobacterium tumefaciens CCNWGS0286]|nr:hypothetical protein ATCR1_14696 [Agrobacterium tumefaciens CCNWGS0286]
MGADLQAESSVSASKLYWWAKLSIIALTSWRGGENQELEFFSWFSIAEILAAILRFRKAEDMRAVIIQNTSFVNHCGLILDLKL